jgi:hypothetical protein
MPELTKEDVEDIFLEFKEDGFPVNVFYKYFQKEHTGYNVSMRLIKNEGLSDIQKQRLRVKKRLDVFKKRYFNNFKYRIGKVDSSSWLSVNITMV